jgi:hypothetical protein
MIDDTILLERNGLVHLPPILARRLTLKTTFSAKWPSRTTPEAVRCLSRVLFPGEPVFARI